MAPRETGNNANAKFWGDKQRALWHVMVYYVFSVVVNYGGQITPIFLPEISDLIYNFTREIPKLLCPTFRMSHC